MSRINKAALRKARQQIQQAAKEGSEEAQERLNRKSTRRTAKRNIRKEVRPIRSKKKVTYNFEPGQLVKIRGRYATGYGATAEEAYLVIGVSNVESRSSVEENYWIDITGPAGLITVRASALRNF